MTTFRKNASWAFLCILLLNAVTLLPSVRPVQASSTIFIKADGGVEPPTAPISTMDRIAYALTDDVFDEVVVERSGITLDGGGFMLQGTGAVNSTGIHLTGVGDVLIKNMLIVGFFSAIKAELSADIEITGNNLTNNDFGVWLHESTRISITENKIQGGWSGINLAWSRNSHLQENTVVDSEYGIILHWSSNNQVLDNRLEDTGCGISLAWASNNNVEGNNVSNYAKRGSCGIRLLSSVGNSIIRNSMTNSLYGVKLLYQSVMNSIVANNITDNWYGVSLGYASNNTIHHNNFIDNADQVNSQKSINAWDDGYPSGGNYWSDYTGLDEKSGAGQDQPGADGVGDKPYVIDEDNRDRYPIIGKIQQPQPTFDASWLYIAAAATIVALLGIMLFVVRRRRKSRSSLSVLTLQAKDTAVLPDECVQVRKSFLQA